MMFLAVQGTSSMPQRVAATPSYSVMGVRFYQICRANDSSFTPAFGLFAKPQGQSGEQEPERLTSRGLNGDGCSTMRWVNPCVCPTPNRALIPTRHFARCAI